MALLMLFVDGVGIGDRGNNPLATTGARAMQFFSGEVPDYGFAGGHLRAIDATLGIDGLPQSATGQTTIFTGVNAAKEINRHLSGMPTRALRTLLSRQSIFLTLGRAGLRATFANAFTPAYFLFPISRMSASSIHMLFAEVKPRWIWQIPDGKALFQDFTNQSLEEAGFDMPLLTPEEAGIILAGMLDDLDFVLYEYFLTDAAGHGRIMRSADAVVSDYDRMLCSILDALDLSEHTVLLCSDHGNVEDASVRTHTRRPVPLAAWGTGAEELISGVESIVGIHDAVAGYYGITPERQ